jgi:hypothetical protein
VWPRYGRGSARPSAPSSRSSSQAFVNELGINVTIPANVNEVARVISKFAPDTFASLGAHALWDLYDALDEGLPIRDAWTSYERISGPNRH